MKPGTLVLAGAAVVVGVGASAALEFGWWPSVEMRTPGGPSHGSRQSVAQIGPADRRVVAPGDKIPIEEAARASATATELAALKQELADLRAAVTDLRRQSRRVAEVTDSAADRVTARPHNDAAARAEGERQRLAQMDARESGFRQEPADAAWASQMSSQIDSALEGLAVAPSGVRDLECRAATCRIELAGDALITQEGYEPVPLDKGLPLLAMRLGGRLPSMTAYQVADGNGGMSTVMYFSRNADAPPSAR